MPLGHARDCQGITGLVAPAGTNLERDGNVHGADHAFKNIADQGFIAHQGRTRCLVADLLGRAAHVDVDNFSTVIGIDASGVCQHVSIAAGNLDRTRAGLAAVVQAQA